MTVAGCVQHKRFKPGGTGSRTDYTPKDGEIIIDQTDCSLWVGDGVTPGGKCGPFYPTPADPPFITSVSPSASMPGSGPNGSYVTGDNLCFDLTYDQNVNVDPGATIDLELVAAAGSWTPNALEIRSPNNTPQDFFGDLDLSINPVNGDIAASYSDASANPALSGSIAIYNSSGAFLRRIGNPIIPTPSGDLFGWEIAYNADGSRILAKSRGHVYVLDPTDGSLLNTISNPIPRDVSLDTHPSNPDLFVMTAAGEITIRNLNGAVIASNNGNPLVGGIGRVFWNRSGSEIITNAFTDTFTVYSASNLSPIRSFNVPISATAKRPDLTWGEDDTTIYMLNRFDPVLKGFDAMSGAVVETYTPPFLSYRSGSSIALTRTGDLLVGDGGYDNNRGRIVGLSRQTTTSTVQATYASGSGTQTPTFCYPIQSGDKATSMNIGSTVNGNVTSVAYGSTPANPAIPTSGNPYNITVN